MAAAFTSRLATICASDREHFAAKVSLMCDLVMETVAQLPQLPSLGLLICDVKEVHRMAASFPELDPQQAHNADLPPVDQTGRRIRHTTMVLCQQMKKDLANHFQKAEDGWNKLNAYHIISSTSNHLMILASMLEWDECGLAAICMEQSLAHVYPASDRTNCAGNGASPLQESQ